MAHCSHLSIEEREDLAAGDTTIYRAVWPGRLDCALPGRRKMSRMLRHRGKSRCRRGSQERRGASGSPSTSARPTTPGRRAPTRTPAGSCATSSRRAGPGWRDWRGGERGPYHAQPQTAQAPRLEVPAGGLLLTGVALALKIRPEKILQVTCMLIVMRRR